VDVTVRLVRVSRRAEEVRTPGAVIDGVRRIVVVRQDRLGDVVLTLPAIEALRRTYSEASVGLVVSPGLGDLSEWVPGVDRVFAVEPTARGIREVLETFGPDLVVAVSRRAAPAVAAFRAGVPHRVGTGFRFFSPLFTRRIDERRKTGGRHELEYALSFAHRVGATDTGPLRPREISTREPAAVDAWLADRGLTHGAFAVVHPGSGGSCPRWPLERYLELIDALARSAVPVVVTVGPGDADVTAVLDARPPRSPPPRFEQSTGALCALIARARLVVSNSTAPVHLAAAQGTPALALHAPWYSCGPTRWGPYSEQGWALVADTDGATDWSRRERARRAPDLMRAIPTSVVLHHALALWQTGRTAPTS
jgi:ADP-heptose:LPS heptosyltransferase